MTSYDDSSKTRFGTWPHRFALQSSYGQAISWSIVLSLGDPLRRFRRLKGLPAAERVSETSLFCTKRPKIRGFTTIIATGIQRYLRLNCNFTTIFATGCLSQQSRFTKFNHKMALSHRHPETPWTTRTGSRPLLIG